jgi:hypothetical protein
METLTLFMEGIRGQTQGTPRLTNAFRFVPRDPACSQSGIWSRTSVRQLSFELC